MSLVEQSWSYIIKNKEDAGIIFYDKLFEIDPTLRMLFKSDMQPQAKKLISMITFVVNKLNQLDAITADIKALGERHKSYKVKPEHYATVGVALLWTLEKALGTKWNDEIKKSWVDAYTILSETMMNA
jgi:hemoglobin-like flavoprotein